MHRGMQTQEPPKGELPITGVYSMGSTSSVGQSCSSDLDIWVCHQAGWIAKSASCCSENAACLRAGLPRSAWKSASS
nr:hypothetical protein [Klebsiella pneumoniae]